MVETNLVHPSELVTLIVRSNYNIKGKSGKIIMSNSQPTKIIRDKIKKTNSTKKGIKKEKKVDFKRMMIKFDKKNQIKS